MSTETTDPTIAERRVALKRRIKKAEIWNNQFSEKQRELAEAKRRIVSELPEAYEAKVGQLQVELNEITDRDLDLQLDGGTLDPESAKRQLELREQIDQASSALEWDIEEAEKDWRRVSRETADFSVGGRENVIDALKNELAALASPDQKLRHHVLKNSVKWCSARVASAEKILDGIRHQLKLPDLHFSNRTKTDLSGRESRAAAELEFAKSESARVSREAEDLWRSFLKD